MSYHTRAKYATTLGQGLCALCGGGKDERKKYCKECFKKVKNSIKKEDAR